jgi:hypothetical protein
MQLSSIAPSVLTANRQVLGSLRTAHELTAKVQDALAASPSRVESGARADIEAALAAATQAREGVTALGAGNLLDGTFQRYSTHSVRHLEHAAQLLGRSALSEDASSILERALFDAEVATRLGTAAGDRSLAKPSPKAIERANDFASSGDAGSAGSGPVWVDGEWLDGLGNPVRGGGDTWTGPDGEGYGWDGSPSRGGDSWTGPDGDSFSGI